MAIICQPRSPRLHNPISSDGASATTLLEVVLRALDKNLQLKGRLTPNHLKWRKKFSAPWLLPGPPMKSATIRSYFAIAGSPHQMHAFSFAGRLAQRLGGAKAERYSLHHLRVLRSDGDQNSLSSSFSSQSRKSLSLPPRPGCGFPLPPDLAIAFELSDVESITVNAGGVITANLPQAARNFLRSSSRGVAGSAGAG